ncbi:unnamed protein product [Staurois parvus]|uniref:Uncharacterized protein n=1 Tax=Staurois parvus TaxID=386267 RepID=A0ABN9B4K6_9NEOB|nr:unnamed protein product [Staurois parvus]
MTNSHLRPLPPLETKRCVNDQFTPQIPHEDPLPAHIVMTVSHLRPLPPLETRYVNDHSHLKFLIKTPARCP